MFSFYRFSHFSLLHEITCFIGIFRFQLQFNVFLSSFSYRRSCRDAWKVILSVDENHVAIHTWCLFRFQTSRELGRRKVRKFSMNKKTILLMSAWISNYKVALGVDSMESFRVRKLELEKLGFLLLSNLPSLSKHFRR